MPYADLAKRAAYNRDYQRALYHRNQPAIKAYLARPEVQERARQRAARIRAMHPEKIAARNAVNNAIRDGQLVRLPCEVCGEKAQAHHHDYSKPLDVRWLCRKHHDQEHGKVTHER